MNSKFSRKLHFQDFAFNFARAFSNKLNCLKFNLDIYLFQNKINFSNVNKKVCRKKIYWINYKSSKLQKT